MVERSRSAVSHILMTVWLDSFKFVKFFVFYLQSFYSYSLLHAVQFFRRRTNLRPPLRPAVYFFKPALNHFGMVFVLDPDGSFVSVDAGVAETTGCGGLASKSGGLGRSVACSRMLGRRGAGESLWFKDSSSKRRRRTDDGAS